MTFIDLGPTEFRFTLRSAIPIGCPETCSEQARYLEEAIELLIQRGIPLDRVIRAEYQVLQTGEWREYRQVEIREAISRVIGLLR